MSFPYLPVKSILGYQLWGYYRRNCLSSTDFLLLLHSIHPTLTRPHSFPGPTDLSWEVHCFFSLITFWFFHSNSQSSSRRQLPRVHFQPQLNLRLHSVPQKLVCRYNLNCYLCPSGTSDEKPGSLVGRLLSATPVWNYKVARWALHNIIATVLFPFSLL